MFESGDIFVNNGIASDEERLNFRYSRLIEPIKDKFENKTIIDLGTHDGRWTYVCWELKAKKVFAYDIRHNLNYESRLEKIGIPGSFFELRRENFEYAQLPEADIVLCLGVLYYLKNPEDFLRKISNYELIIVDTRVDLRSMPSKEQLESWLGNFFTFEELGNSKECEGKDYLSDYSDKKRFSYLCKPK